MVSAWLASVGVKENYIKTLHEQEVDGQVLHKVTEEYLMKQTGMKSGPAHLITKSRNELVKIQKVQKQQTYAQKMTAKSTDQGAPGIVDLPISSSSQKEEQMEQDAVNIKKKRDSNPRPFGKPGTDYSYVKHDVLPPETGVSDLITPCHEYKSFSIAATLEQQKFRVKLAYEVLRFATGCINMRSNGTIHLGVMDSKDGSGYAHGEIIGIPVKNKDMYTVASNVFKKCFEQTQSKLMQECIRSPEFILVVEPNRKEEHYVVEFDVEPLLSIVRKEVFYVSLPRFNNNKMDVDKERKPYMRVGAETEPVDDIQKFFKGVDERDSQRETAEKSQSFMSSKLCQDPGRKLITLITSGKKQIEKDKWYILVTNRFSDNDLQHIDFLLNMKLFCVFDFDPDSKVSGLCHKYVQNHTVNLHFMQNYTMQSNESIREVESHLCLFEQTSWIFCNGRNDFKGNEPPYDENTWCKTRRTLLRDCVSLICKNLLPKGTFLVIFLLTSPVETPLLKTFDEFYTDMQGHEDIICISESENNFQKWQAFALEFCDMETVNSSSVVGLKMSHINTTVQQVQSPSTCVNKLLPVSNGAKCHLLTRVEEAMSSLEILGVNQCDDISKEDAESKRKKIETDFYRGGKVKWENFWLAEEKYVGQMIERDAYHDVINLLDEQSIDHTAVKCITIYHHAGSGGSTVARQVLWKYRKNRRCAVVKTSNISKVSAHAVKLQEYEEKDPQKCSPVLLLIEDCEREFVEELKYELETAMKAKKMHGLLCFILLSCRRSYDPEKRKAVPLQSVSVIHKLSDKEKKQFSKKQIELKKLFERDGQFQPELILTFVLMSKEFNRTYLEEIVQNILRDVDHASTVTQLIRYIALLNTYVENSCISQSHCEALLQLQLSVYGERFRQHSFENSLSEQAKLLFIHLRDEKTYINSIRIIHQVVAKEVLHQLLGNKQQSELALELLRNDVLFNHRFGGDEYRKFLRELFIRRSKTSRGDKSDTLFSPLIEHVRRKENEENALKLLQEAYERFNKDAFFAQQLARLFYWNERFKEAESWAEKAVTKMPKNSYILDTKAQVYRRWFSMKCKAMKKSETPEYTTDAIETALKAIECFQKCQTVAVEESEAMNNSGFFGVVEVGCSLLKLISSLEVFSNKGHSELQKYLLTEHIPEEVEAPWKHFHYKLKALQPTMHKALEWISEELSFFQNPDTDEEETKTPELTIHYPKRWLANKSSFYAKFFCEVSVRNTPGNWQSNVDNMTDFSKRMKIYQLGGGNFTTIFSILDQKSTDQKNTDPQETLQNIISLYPKDGKMDQADLINYITSNLALSTISPTSRDLPLFSNLQKFSHSFLKDKSQRSSTAFFLCTLLFWPENSDSDEEKKEKYQIVLTAVRFLQQAHETKMKDVPARRRRICTHLYLGNGRGFGKFVHKNKIETIRKYSSLPEKRQKWLEGEVWKSAEISQELKRVEGWTEDENVYLEVPNAEKFSIHPLNIRSVPAGNENVTFYLGFTFRGPVACDITVGKLKNPVRMKPARTTSLM
ncbi:LOW QUALITY PROTEIN: sterile alpha motif domain-containing protein 9-like [Clarias gariepinus]